MTSWNSGSGDIHGMHIGGWTLGEYSRGETGSYRGREYKGGGGIMHLATHISHQNHPRLTNDID